MIGWLKRQGNANQDSQSLSNPTEVAISEPFPRITESWLSRLTMILSGLEREGSLPIAVALLSSIAREGVSTVTVNLAHEIVRTLGWRVLLLDANLATPTLHRISTKTQGPGLGNVLRKEVGLDAAIEELTGRNIGLIRTGSYFERDLVTLFSRDAITKIISAIDPARWDIVLLDCPPLLAHPGSAVIAAQTDAAILIVQAEKTRLQVAGKALENLRAQNAEVLGVILNRVNFYVPGWLYRHL